MDSRVLATGKAAADAFNVLFTIALTGGAAMGQASAYITISGSFMGALGGFIGGLLLVNAVPRMTNVQRFLACFLSACIGFAFAPIFAIVLGSETGWYDPRDIWTRVPAGAFLGAVTPWIYKLFTRFIRAVEENPIGVVDGLKKAHKLLPTISWNGNGKHTDN